MNKITYMLFFACIIVGSVTSTVVDKIVPLAFANDSDRWEHKCVADGFLAKDATDKANRLGAQGWQLVSHSSEGQYMGYLCFKRQGS
ncbi:MAG: hypothetical protein HRU19_31605 [Pseudobacteriovorax sp.]|nr:hypothetical protein [Pseudobacteriovorax sp.]